MSPRRSRFEIYLDVLNEIKNGANKPTQIMYSSNLSWRPCQEIFESLTDQELIIELEGDNKDKRTKRVYDLTQKGINVIRYYNKAKDLVEIQSPKDYDVD
jgi:predicted transcriptional regulator